MLIIIDGMYTYFIKELAEVKVNVTLRLINEGSEYQFHLFHLNKINRSRRCTSVAHTGEMTLFRQVLL